MATTFPASPGPRARRGRGRVVVAARRAVVAVAERAVVGAVAAVAAVDVVVGPGSVLSAEAAATTGAVRWPRDVHPAVTSSPAHTAAPALVRSRRRGRGRT